MGLARFFLSMLWPLLNTACKLLRGGLIWLAHPVMIAAIASALAGTWLYGFLRPRLPH